MFGLIIFDCDGVLVDTERLGVKIDVEVLASLGWKLSESELVERFTGVSDADYRRAIEAQIGRPLPHDWEAQIQPRYHKVFSEQLTAVEGVVAALDQIDVPTCVASSGTHEKMRFTLGLTGLYERFAGRIYSATEVTSGKPAPDLFLHAARAMGVDPASCIVVEDSVNGVAAARAAGMHALGYAGGVTPAAKLAGPGTTVFEHMRDLPGLIANIAGSHNNRDRTGGGAAQRFVRRDRDG